MARPKNDPNAPAPPKNHVEAVERGTWTVGDREYTLDVSDIDSTTPDDPVMAQKIDFAEKAMAERTAANEKVAAVRELLTLLIQTGSGSQDQVAWVRFNLPRKSRGKGEQDETEQEQETTAEASAETVE